MFNTSAWLPYNAAVQRSRVALTSATPYHGPLNCLLGGAITIAASSPIVAIALVATAVPAYVE
jgi:hypothetical protein